MLYQPDDTFYRTWILKPLFGGGAVRPLKAIKIEGLADLDGDNKGTVFDIFYGPFLTDKTRHGRPFEVTAIPEELLNTISATYSDPIRVLPALQPEWDIYGTLLIDFGDGRWDGTTYAPDNAGAIDAQLEFIAYIADTDCADLPVSLDSFNATSIGAGVKLNWSTGVEIDNAAFFIWRATKNELGAYANVVRMGPVAAKAGAASGANYTFIDNTVSGSDTFYYLVEDVNTGGESAYHWDHITSVTK